MARAPEPSGTVLTVLSGYPTAISAITRKRAATRPHKHPAATHPKTSAPPAGRSGLRCPSSPERPLRNPTAGRAGQRYRCLGAPPGRQRLIRHQSSVGVEEDVSTRRGSRASGVDKKRHQRRECLAAAISRLLTQVVSSHGFLAMRGRVCLNPYYLLH